MEEKVDYNSLPGEHQSALKKILEHPVSYLGAKKRDDGPSPDWAINGHLFEDMLLGADVSSKYYKLPSGTSITGAVKEIVDLVHLEVLQILHELPEGATTSLELADYMKQITLILSRGNIDYYNNRKMPSRVSSVVKAGSKYFTSLFQSAGKISISEEDYNKCRNACAATETDRFIQPILNNPTRKDKQVIQFKLMGVDMVSEIDFYIKDDTLKIIFPYDIKSTSKQLTPKKFTDQFINLGYDFQDVVYQKGLQEKFPEYKVMPLTFIVKELHTSNRPLLFQAHPEVRQTAINKVKEAISRWQFHTEKDLWEHPMESYMSNGIIVLQ